MILVTGAAGFIGYHVAARLLERGDEVLGVDDSPARFAPVREVPPLCGAAPGGASAVSPSSST